MRTRLVLLVCLLSALPALGLEPYMVKDINPVPEPGDSSPDNFVTLGSVALFSADDGLTGRELWRSDGTGAGTWQVEDLCQPACSGIPSSFAVTDRAYFFVAADAETQALWATDGTAAGTFRLTDASVRIEIPRTRVGNVLYFVAWDYDHGEELWRSDGTPAGTYRVAELQPGPEGSSPRSLTAFKGALYFSAYGPNGGALWKTDGTAAGTVLVKDPLPQFPTNSGPESLQVVGSRLVFVAPALNRPQALWSSDGTTQGTDSFRGVFAAGFTQFRDFSAQGSRLYFIAEDTEKGQELWVTDGTPKGTRRLTNLPRNNAFFGPYTFLPLPRTSLGNRFVFAAFDAQHGAEPWVTDGTVKGTRRLKDLCPGPCPGLVTTTIWDRSLPGRVFLLGTDGTHGFELWVTDGTEAGTRLVRDICRGSCDSGPSFPFVVGNRLVFVAGNGFGRELWSTDGTAAGTVRISNFVPASPWGVFGGAVAGGQLLFLGEGPEGRELWRTDGTPAGTRLVHDINQADLGGSDPSGLMPLGDEVVFFADDGTPGLWKSDGSEAGTVRVTSFKPVGTDRLHSAEAAGKLFFNDRDNKLWRTDGTEAGTFPLGAVCCELRELEAVGGTVFFQTPEGPNGPVALWASDGTVTGTRRIPHGSSGPFEPVHLTPFREKLYFAAIGGEPDQGWGLWRSDGTEAGTALVKDVQPGFGVSPSHFTVHAGRLWFFVDDGEHGSELWSSDGTAQETALAVDLEPGPDSFDARLMVSLGDRLLVYGSTSSQGSGIWVTDGTGAGTRKIGPQFVFEQDLSHILFKGRFYFLGANAAFQAILWVTDGTEAGTFPFRDGEGMEIAVPQRFAVLGDRLVFTSGYGMTLWESDGTPQGTFRLIPETRPDSRSIPELIRAGSRVFFPAYSRENGVELWAVEESHP